MCLSRIPPLTLVSVFALAIMPFCRAKTTGFAPEPNTDLRLEALRLRGVPTDVTVSAHDRALLDQVSASRNAICSVSETYH